MKNFHYVYFHDHVLKNLFINVYFKERKNNEKIIKVKNDKKINLRRFEDSEEIRE